MESPIEETILDFEQNKAESNPPKGILKKASGGLIETIMKEYVPYPRNH